MPDDVMDVKAVAEYLGVTKATIYKWVEYRKIPFTKVGSLLRFPKWLIDQYLSKRAVLPEEEFYDEFARLKSRWHLKQWLLSQGLDRDKLTDQQLHDELRRAIKSLSADDKTGR